MKNDEQNASHEKYPSQYRPVGHLVDKWNQKLAEIDCEVKAAGEGVFGRS